MAVRVRFRFRFVPDQDVDVGEDLVNLGLEELGDERRREVHREDLSAKRSKMLAQFLLSDDGDSYLVLSGGVLSEDLGGFNSVGEEEASQVEELGSVDESLDLGSLKVGRLERLGRSEGGAKRAATMKRPC